MATHSSILAWKIPWTEEPGGIQSMGSQESDIESDGASLRALGHGAAQIQRHFRLSFQSLEF